MTNDSTTSNGRQSLDSRARACVYTVLFGGYERLTEQPAAHTSSLDFVCLTDDPTIVSETWTVRLVEPLLPQDPVRSQRALKIRAHAVVAEYDVSLYIDNSIRLKTTPEVVLGELLPPDVSFAVIAHGFRETVADEFTAVVSSGLDTVDRCEEQAAHYAEIDPPCLGLRPLKGFFLLRRHHDPRVVAAMDLWLTHVLRYSRRDQLSLPFVLRATGLEPLVHELDNFESPYHSWPVSSGRSRDGSLWLPRLHDLEQAHNRLADAESALEALRASRSWRWTRPARGAASLLRRTRTHQPISDSASAEPSQAATSR